MQIKVFNGNGYNETEINAWLKENSKINIILISHQPMFDYYACYSPPQICNQWIATTIIYDNPELLQEVSQ